MGGGDRGGPRNVIGMVSRMLGIEIEDPKAAPKLDVLPVGPDRRFVFNVPVGGVDTPSATGSGWKVESVFKATDEQKKSLDALRDEYAAEQKKLEKEVQDQYKAMAEKAKELRLRFEKRANDVLTGDDKTRKEQMDALAREINAKNAEVVQDTMQLFDPNDWQQGFAMVRTIRERLNKTAQQNETRFLELVPAENKEKIEEVLKQHAAGREQMGRWMNFGGRRGPDGGPEGGDAIKPPRPPEADKKVDF
jgi:hypothetical protein